MFDLKNIDFVKTDEERGCKSYSFVGLKRKENSERLEFWLPLGFDAFETGLNNPTSFDRVKTFFFKMYRTFQIYKKRKLNSLKEEEKTKDRDGVFEFENGFSFVNENNEHVVFYGKLNALDKILEGYDELRISSLEKKQLRSHQIDYSKINRYMHQAIYLDDDVIYLDEMNIAKNILIQDSPTIIQLFCFIYTEIKKELEELNTIPNKAFDLSDSFKDNYLQPDSSLFAKDTFADTINILKNVFEEIDNKTLYKDEDFWHFYEAIEAFLMGERLEDDNGIYFGISNFYDIWEDMCQSYMLDTENIYLPQILFADIKNKLQTRKDLGLKPELYTNPFKLELNKGFKPRYLKPDLVLIKTIDIKDNKKILNNFFITESILKGLANSKIDIIDYKYMRQLDYINFIDEGEINKITEDIHKQLIYEWTIQQNFKNSKTASEFWIPYYADDLNFEKSKLDVTDTTSIDFKKSEIKVIKINFKALQDYYVKISNIS